MAVAQSTLPRVLAVTAVFAWGALAWPSASAQAPTPLPRFIIHDVGTGLRGGYQVLPADLNRDGRPDLIAVASSLTELVWFENPSWRRHVLMSGARGLINVAATDLDNDGVPEIAVAHGFSTRPDQSVGNVTLLTHGPDVTQPWTAREIDRVPTAHRLRWYTAADGQKWLINSPLSGATAAPPNYDGATPIFAYRGPDWKRETVTTAEHGVVHAVEVIPASTAPYPFDPAGRRGDRLLSAGFAGVHRYSIAGTSWERTRIVGGAPGAAPTLGSSDVGAGRAPAPFLATIEPWHGNQLVVYALDAAGSPRTVVDSALTDAHTLITADLDGDGRDEIVVGQRGGNRTAWIYRAAAAGSWIRTALDTTIAAAGCTAADLNGDRRIDIACIGTASAALRWYENTGSPSSPAPRPRNRR